MPRKTRKASVMRAEQKSVHMSGKHHMKKPQSGGMSRRKKERMTYRVRRGLSFAGGPSSIKIGDPTVNPFKKPSNLPFSQPRRPSRQPSKQKQRSTYNQSTKQNQRRTQQSNRRSDSGHQLKITTLRNVLQIDEQTANRVLTHSNGSVREAMNFVLREQQQNEQLSAGKLKRRTNAGRVQVF